MIDDNINLQSGNPLMGKNYDQLGDRFPEMSIPYITDLNNLLSSKAPA